MTKLDSVASLDKLGRKRLSTSFFMRDFLYSEVANFHGIPNIPDDPEAALMTGTRLCEDLLEPLQATFGRVVIRSAYRSSKVTEYCNQMQKEKKPGYTCASNEKNYARHIWDKPDKDHKYGAMACVLIPWFGDRYSETKDWKPMAYWIHDHLPYSELEFYPKHLAFNIGWHQDSKRTISSYVGDRGSLNLTEETHTDFSSRYAGFPAFKKGGFTKSSAQIRDMNRPVTRMDTGS